MISNLNETYDFALTLNEQDLSVYRERVADAAGRIQSMPQVEYLEKTRQFQDESKREYAGKLGMDLSEREQALMRSTSEFTLRFGRVFGVTTDSLQLSTDTSVAYYEEMRSRYLEMSDQMKKKIEQQPGKEKEEGSWVWDQVKDLAHAGVTMAQAAGVDTSFLTFRGALAQLGLAEVRRREDTSQMYQAAAMGMGLSDTSLNVEKSLQEYLEGIRTVRTKWPSLTGTFDVVIESLQRSLPGAGMKDLMGTLEDTRRLAFYTGQAFDTTAKRVGTVAREFDLTGLEAVQDLVYVNDVGRSLVEMYGVNIDLERFRENTVNLARLAIPFGFSLRDAADMSGKYALSLNNGTLSIQDLIQLVTGYTKGGPGKMAFLSGLMKQNLNPEGEFKEILDLLGSYEPRAASRLIETIATRSKTGYNEFGMAGKYKDAERIAELLQRAIMETLNIEVQRFGFTKAESNLWLEQILINLGMLDRSKTPDERRALIEGGDIEARRLRKQKTADAANRYTGDMKRWREFIDDNQKYEQDVFERVNQYVKTLFDQFRDWHTWMDMTFPYLGGTPENLLNRMYAPVSGPLRRAAELVGVEDQIPKAFEFNPPAPASGGSFNYADRPRSNDVTPLERVRKLQEKVNEYWIQVQPRKGQEAKDNEREKEMKEAQDATAGVQ